MLTFLTPVKEDSLGILMPQFLKALKNKGITSFGTDMQKSMQRVFGEKLVTGKQHIFLRPGSKLTSIPSGRLARKHPEAVYVRCIVLAKSALSEETCMILEQGIYYNSIHTILLNFFLSLPQ